MNIWSCFRVVCTLLMKRISFFFPLHLCFFDSLNWNASEQGWVKDLREISEQMKLLPIMYFSLKLERIQDLVFFQFMSYFHTPLKWHIPLKLTEEMLKTMTEPAEYSAQFADSRGLDSLNTYQTVSCLSESNQPFSHLSIINSGSKLSPLPILQGLPNYV